MLIESLSQSKVIVDTSAIYAMYVDSDSNHEDALTTLNLIHENRYKLFLCPTTIQEAYTLILKKTNWRSANNLFQWLEDNLETTQLVWQPTAQTETQRLLNYYKGVKISYHDALCVAYATSHSIGKVFTFDDDFKIMGMDTIPF